MLHRQQEKEQLQFLTNILNSIGDGVIVTDRNEKVLYINAYGEKLTGWNKKEAEGMLFNKVFPLVDYSSGRDLESPIQNARAQAMTVGLKNILEVLPTGIMLLGIDTTIKWVNKSLLDFLKLVKKR